MRSPSPVTTGVATPLSVSADVSFLADRNAGAAGSGGGHSRPGHRQFSDVHSLAGWAGSTPSSSSAGSNLVPIGASLHPIVSTRIELKPASAAFISESGSQVQWSATLLSLQQELVRERSRSRCNTNH